MAQSPATHAPGTKPRQGLLHGLLTFPLRILMILLGSWLLSVIVEWLGMLFLWPEQGAEHSRQMMLTELGWFAEEFTRSLLLSQPLRRAEQVLEHIHHGLFTETGLSHWLHPSQTAQPLYRLLADYVLSALYITLTFALRVMILLLTLPLFVLTTLVGLVDGLVRRDLRRFGSGYESGFIYHHAKRTIAPTFLVAGLVYLSLPFSVHPNLILLPAAVLSGVMVSVTVGSFKKYL